MNGPDYEQLTLFPADSPASHLVLPGSEKARMMTVTSGRKCSELSENLRRVGLSVKTYLESCELPLPTLSRGMPACVVAGTVEDGAAVEAEVPGVLDLVVG